MNRRALLHRALVLSLLSIVISGLVGGLAVAVALSNDSLSLLGFGFDAAIDSAASLALVWRFRIEARQPDRAHRVETIAEAVVGAALLVLAAYVAFNAAGALIRGARPDSTFAGTALLAVCVVILPFLAVAKARVAKRLGSGALRADSLLTGISVVLAVISLVGLGLTEALGFFWADAVGALAVAAIMVREGIASLRAIRTVDPI
ncbi:MAG TPA: cation transporter [Candidatus Limnocylindrales bacterium]|nr:cation transporter [Candidatus Limnocylindrales bacterium]